MVCETQALFSESELELTLELGTKLKNLVGLGLELTFFGGFSSGPGAQH